jgi:hypothetical protein
MQAASEFGNLDKKSQKEVQTFIEQQQQMQQVQAIVGKITELCWDKCVSKPGKELSDTEKVVSSFLRNLSSFALFSLLISKLIILFVVLAVSCKLFRAISGHKHVCGEPYSIQEKVIQMTCISKRT